MVVWLMLVNWRKEIRSPVNFVRMICPAVETLVVEIKSQLEVHNHRAVNR